MQIKSPTPITIITLAATIIALGVLATILILSDADPTRLAATLVIIIPVIGVLLGIQQIGKQTNGTLTHLRNENAALHAVATPEQVEQARALLPETGD